MHGAADMIMKEPMRLLLLASGHPVLQHQEVIFSVAKNGRNSEKALSTVLLSIARKASARILWADGSQGKINVQMKQSE